MYPKSSESPVCLKQSCSNVAVLKCLFQWESLHKQQPFSCFSLQCLTAEGGLDYHWDSCIKGYNQVNKVRALANYEARLLHFLHRVDSVKQMANLNVVNHFRVLPFFVPCHSPPHSHTSHPPTVSSTSCTTAVRPMGLRARRPWRGAPVRLSRCHCCSPTCWLHQPTPLTCCCSRICPAGMSL